MLQEADRHYKQKDYYEAANVLYPVADEEESACQSEALFYLAIIALQLEDPEPPSIALPAFRILKVLGRIFTGIRHWPLLK